MKKIIKSVLLTLFTVFYFQASAQTTYNSSSYPYSFNIINGWRVKEQKVLPETDAKIVDGRGNSFIVTVKPIPQELKNKSFIQELSSISDEEFKMTQSPSDFDNLIITKRGSTYVGSKEFYYVFINQPFLDGLRLNHRLFFTNYNNKAYSIDCAFISSMPSVVSTDLDLMLQTFRFK